jgi:hypothetical protein
MMVLCHVRMSESRGKPIIPWIDPNDKREIKETMRRFHELTSECRVRYAPRDEIERLCVVKTV